LARKKKIFPAQPKEPAVKSIALPQVDRATQAISVTIRIAGPHEVTVDTHGKRTERGAHIAVATAGVAVYMYTATAAETYSDGWIDLAASPILNLLPGSVEPGKADRQAGADSPAVVITAHGHDQARHSFVPANRDRRAAAAIRIGRAVWLVEDRAAAETLICAWRQVHNLIPVIFDPIRSHTPVI